MATIYAPFAASAEWPKYQYVDKELDAVGVDLTAALEEMPQGLLVPDPRWPGHFLQPGDEMALTVRGLAAVGAAADIELFVRFLKLVAGRERDFRPSSPTAAEELAVTSAEVAAELGVGELELRKLWALTRVEPLLGSGGGHPDDWRYEIRRDVRRYRDVTGVDDYLRLRPDPGARRCACRWRRRRSPSTGRRGVASRRSTPSRATR